jgi:hypothetical protein
MGRHLRAGALLICAAVALVRGAGAQELAPEALAVRANEVHQTWCADIYGTEISAAAAGYREVAEVWAELDAHLQVTSDAPLTYWRGVLAQCLGQEQRAAEDLGEFLQMLAASDDEDREILAAMEEDALRRRARIDRRAAPGDGLIEVSVTRRRRTAGAVVLSAGTSAAAIGFVVNTAVYHRYIGTEDPATYNWAAGVSQAGLVVGIVGALTSAVGFVLVVAPATKSARVSVGPGPWVSLEVAF